MSRNPTLAAVLNDFKASMFADMRVAVPARVERYDAATQLIDAKPLLRDTFTTEEGEREIVSLPVITNVPVVFPGAGGFRLTFPVAVGDTVLLVFADRSIDAWLAHGGETSPTDERHHHLSDAIAIPGLHPNNAPLTGASTSDATLGRDGGVQLVMQAASLLLGGTSAVDSVLKGTTQRAAETTLNAAFITALGTMAAAFTTLGQTAAGTACGTLATAITTYETAGASYLSTTTKVL